MRLLAGLSMVTGIFLSAIGLVQSMSDAAGAQTNLGGAISGMANNVGEYSLCQYVGSGSVCSDRGKATASDIQGAIAVDGNFQGDVFYIGSHLQNSTALAAAGNVGGTFAIQGSNNIGVYGGTDMAQLPPVLCASTPCPTPNLVYNPSLLPDFSAINTALENESASLTGTASTGFETFDPFYRTLTLTSTATDNTFYVTGTELAQVRNLYIYVPAGSSTVINVSGNLDCVTGCLQNVFYNNPWTAGGQYGSATYDQLRANTILNFPPSVPEPSIVAKVSPFVMPTSIDLQHGAPAINFLAPWSDFTFDSGALNGFVYADQVNGDFQTNVPGGVPFPTTTTTTNFCCVLPTTTTTVAPTKPRTPKPPVSPKTKGRSGTTTTTAVTTTTTAVTTTTTAVTTGAAATTTVPVAATTTLPGTGPSAATTTLASAATTTVPSAATTTTVPGRPSLAFTGSDSGPMTGAGLALIVGGGLVMGLAARRRRLA